MGIEKDSRSQNPFFRWIDWIDREPADGNFALDFVKKLGSGMLIAGTAIGVFYGVAVAPWTNEGTPRPTPTDIAPAPAVGIDVTHSTFGQRVLLVMPTTLSVT
jgi:hypothetical protein